MSSVLRRCFALTALLLVVPASASAEVRPLGTTINRTWPAHTGYTAQSAALTVLDVASSPSWPLAKPPYFWAHQISFVHGDGGYVGLQSGGSSRSGIPGKVAVFSLWKADNAEAPAMETCRTFDNEGSGHSCILDYDWKLGRKYHMSITRGPDDGQPGSWWTGSVVDTTTGVATTIGSIHVPWTDGLGWWSTTFTEYFGRALATCAAQPYSRVRWGALPVNNGDQPVNELYYYTGESCDNARLTAEASGNVLQEAGGTTTKPPPAPVPAPTPAPAPAPAPIPPAPKGDPQLAVAPPRGIVKVRGSNRRSLLLSVSYASSVPDSAGVGVVVTGPRGFSARLFPYRRRATPGNTARREALFRAQVPRSGRYKVSAMFYGSVSWASAKAARSFTIR